MARGIIYAIISACAFGLLPVFGKIGYAHGMDTFEILQYRFVFGFLMLAGYFAVTNPSLFRISRKSLIKAAALGFIAYPMQSTGYIGAVKYIPASTTALIIYGYPALVTILSALIFKERITRSLTTSLVLIFAGCALVFFDAFQHEADIRGIAYAISCMLGITVNMLLAQVLLKGENPLAVTLYVLFFAGAFFSCIAGVPTHFFELDRTGVILALSLGLVPTVFAIVFMYLAIDTVGGTYTSIFSCVEPITTVFCAWLLLGEPLVAWQIFGAALILTGIVWPNLKFIRMALAEAHPA
ncbi:drug/metabolite transporter (DMT)-like permease [Desulfobaculum xiamenense]|uniref:Drug/metabolite transporter (DMT)-like permease n=1 Tax=Desulfobaculum xiamenense TaxID=995050 RepID=A0A846QUK8_9BACT|nr:drug/metabolite transporter (DMT)-like permease [Desulfobaculum xiamenense]